MKITSTRYEQAYCQAWDELPAWKRVVVKEDMKLGIDSRFVDEFVHNARILAEAEAKLHPKSSVDQVPVFKESASLAAK